MYFLPALSFLITFLGIFFCAIPFLLVFTVYFLPLNMNVTFLPANAFPLLNLRVAFKTSFLDDFLNLTALVFKTCFTLILFLTVYPLYVEVMVYVFGFNSIGNVA